MDHATPAVHRFRLASFLLVACGLAAACSGGGGGGSNPTPTPSPSPSPTGTPVLTALSGAEGVPGTTLTLTGTGFGDAQGTGEVLIGTAVATTVQAWSATSIDIMVPDEAIPGTQDVTVETSEGLSNALPFRVLMPPAVYVNVDVPTNNEIEAFAVGGAGVLSRMAGSPYVLDVSGSFFGGYPGEMAVHTPTRRLFTASEYKVHAWSIHPRTGAISTSGSITLDAASRYPYDVAATADGARIFATGYMNSAISVADVTAEGALSPVAGSPFVTDGGASGADTLELSRSGKWLLVNDETDAMVHVHAVAADGSLAEVAGSPFTLPGTAYYMELAPDADRLYVAGYTSNDVSVWNLDDTDGTLTEDVGLRTDLGLPASSLAFTADGSRLFVVDFQTGAATSNIYVFDVSATDGALTAVTGSPFATGYSGLTGIEANEDGSLLFLTHEYGTIELVVFSVDAAGTPTEAAGSPYALSTDGAPSGMAITF